MPVLFIYGVSKSNKLLKFSDALKVSVANSAEELKLKPSGVSCFFPEDLIKNHGDDEILIFVECLTDKPERTDEVRDKLAKALVETAGQFYPGASLIECFVMPFKHTQGFASLKR